MKPDESLRKVLRGWVVDAALPPRFEQRVWERVNRAESRRVSNRWAGLRSWLELKSRRPAFIVSYLAVLLFAGVLAGHQQGQSQSRQSESKMKARYLQMVDPYQGARR